MLENKNLHDEIIQVLFELCKKAKTGAGKPFYPHIYADHIGVKFKPIILTAYKRKKKALAKKYFPDVWAQNQKKTQVDVYEVWHTEADAIEDVLFSSFVGGIRDLHIVCTEGNLTCDEAEELIDFVLYRTYDEEGKKPLNPNDVYLTDLPTETWKDKAKMKRYLKKQLDF